MEETIEIYLSAIYPNGYPPEAKEEIKIEIFKLMQVYTIATIKAKVKQNPGKALNYIFNEIKADKEEEENILDPFKKYVHNELRELPDPPWLEYFDDGTSKWHIDTTPIKQKAYYTYEDALKYYNKKLNRKLIDQKRDIGAIKYMANLYGLEEILYAVDAAVDECTDRDLKMPKEILDIYKYIHYGIERLAIKRAEVVEYELH